MQLFNLLKTIMLTLFVVCFVQSAIGQGQITGLVREGSTTKPMPDASVLILNATDSSLVMGQISNDDGSFRLEGIPAGSYLLRVTSLGFYDYLSTVFSFEDGSSNKTWPPIDLLENAALISGVEVVAKKPLYEQKIDRMLINVSASSVNAGGNALQVLQRSPGVLVNKQSNSISMSGKNGVIIMINGKISRMPPDAILQLLEGTSADNIERIELIHTPPSSFDAEGSAGIINIVLKQSPDSGLSGNYAINGGYGKREKYGASVTLNYRHNKVNLFGSYSYQFDHNPQVFTNYRGIYRDSSFLETDGISTRSPDLANQNARLGADFQLSKKTVIGVVGSYFERYWDMYAINNIDKRNNQLLDSRVVMKTLEVNRWNSATGNVNLTHQFSETKTLTMDADYVYYKIHNPSSYVINNFDAQNQPIDTSELNISKETPIQIYVGKIDYVQSFGKNTQFETGLKASRSLFDNDVKVNQFSQGVWSPNTELTSYFKLIEDVAAAYASISFKASAKTDLKFGLRYEYTNTNLGSVEQPNIVDRQYGSLFPSVYYARNINENNHINLSYSRRIARPGFTQLAPYLIFYDPSTVQSGNPSLQPSFVDAIRTDYTFKTLSLTVEYNQESPSIRDVPFVNIETNTQISRPENIGKTHTAYAMVNHPYHPTKWWEMRNSVFIAWQRFDMIYQDEAISIPTQFTGFNSVHSFTLPKDFSAELSAGMITANYSGLYRYKANGTINCSIQKDLGERWGKLNFGVLDILQSNNYFGTANQPELNLLVKASYQQAERTFMLTWTNKFGNKKLKDARQRQSGASDEMRRL